jgi:hypothetical protein
MTAIAQTVPDRIPNIETPIILSEGDERIHGHHGHLRLRTNPVYVFRNGACCDMRIGQLRKQVLGLKQVNIDQVES